MKFKLSTMFRNDSSLDILVETPDGVYLVNFERNHVCFEKNVHISDILVGNVLHECEFTAEDLMPKKGMNGVRYYPCLNTTVGHLLKKDIVMEYLDTSAGRIPRHNHPGCAVEVYLSVDAPYTGMICGIGEFHEPFCDQTIAVKMIYK